MLKRKDIADYLNNVTALTSLCSVYGDVPKETKSINGNYLYPTSVIDNQNQYTNKGQVQRQAIVRINVVLKKDFVFSEYPEQVAYDIIEQMNIALLDNCGTTNRVMGGVRIVSIQSNDVAFSGYINDRNIYSKQYTFIYRTDNV